jgi:aldose 1-epimerase
MGEAASVTGTPYDFTRETMIGEHAAQEDAQLKRIGGFDHDWVLRGPTATLRPAARLFDPGSGRILLVQTTEPGIQFNSNLVFDDDTQLTW